MNYDRIYENIISNASNRKITVGYSEKHHILPKSLGGGDEKINLVTLTAKEHFLCHLLLTKMYEEGTPEWCKMIKAFMYMNISSNNQKRYTSISYSYYRERFAKVQSIMQAGTKNSSYGTMWIHNLEQRISKKHKKNETIPEGWIEGRVINFDSDMVSYNKRQRIKKLKQELGEAGFKEYVRKKLSDTMKKIEHKPHSEETKKKMSASKKGVPSKLKGRKRGPHSDVTKMKISKRMSGNKNPMWGKTHSEETKIKMTNALKGHKHSEETKQKIRETMLSKRRNK